MKKSQKKKIQKIQDVKLHQHKTFENGIISTHGFPHPINALHTKEETRKSHEVTIMMDVGIILTPKVPEIKTSN